MKWLTRLLRSHDIGEAVALAKYYHRLGMACKRRSVCRHDPWAIAAKRYKERALARLWEARQLVK